MHEHTEPKDCKHELKYCKKCDTVYCEKCSKEWKNNILSWSYTTPTTSVFPTTYPPYTIYGNGTATDCTHN
jgi:hypothetical protein